jgi:DNA-binding XRE family transcriptional regulator
MTQMIHADASALSMQVSHALRRERASFGAKVRVARAVLDLSQDEFARGVGLTQKSVHRIEQGIVEPKLRTLFAIERYWIDHGVAFEDLQDGGFRLVVEGPMFSQG